MVTPWSFTTAQTGKCFQAHANDPRDSGLVTIRCGIERLNTHTPAGKQRLRRRHRAAQSPRTLTADSHK